MKKQKKSKNKSPLKILPLIIIIVIGVFAFCRFKNANKKNNSETYKITVIGDSYTKINNKIFYQGREITEADPKTFKVLPDGTAQDKNRKYNFNIDSPYVNTLLGIKFEYGGYEFKDKLKTKNNQIYYQYEGTDNIAFIEIYSKKPNQTIENAILDLVKSKGKDPTKCKVKKTIIEDYPGSTNHPKYSTYIIDLANPKITYTKEELGRINDSKIEKNVTNFAETTEHIKKEIYNSRLIETCSDYANPSGLASSPSFPSRFLFDGKSKFVFFPSTVDPTFYQEPTIELFE